MLGVSVAYRQSAVGENPSAKHHNVGAKDFSPLPHLRKSANADATMGESPSANGCLLAMKNPKISKIVVLH
jgi:hypothetical protein